ncbi:hypothetical protein PR202_ga07427 [Eleusine coracana subsp. coracana]|uniref:Nucleoside phosphorylase domain-containing protein n=1 Tax=Eleusine coracana subsp. coracana TaxID=191504 RepID=A0AAV5BY08_ELECO|nr:hypothetical protein PR202_ga07427 [Eleusine coracana subsp. coracana]
MVMTGLSMGIVHWGIAGNANEDLQIGDATIPEHWAHLSLWNWQRYGDGPENELPLEAAGDYTRKFGFLNFSDYTVGKTNPELSANTLNSIWYQPEEIDLPRLRHAGAAAARVLGAREQALLRPQLAGELEGLELPACVNATSSSGPTSDAPPVEMESAAIALVAHQLGVPFLTIRSLSDLAGGGSSLSNEAATFLSIAAQNAVDVMLKFVPLLGNADKAGM